MLHLAEAPNLREGSTIDSQGSSLLHTIKASCKSVPYSDEAATDARTKMFALWNFFGPPFIFLQYLQLMSAVSESNYFAIPQNKFYQIQMSQKMNAFQVCCSHLR